MQAYPLKWPEGRPRTRSAGESRFKVGDEKALKFLLAEVRRMGGENLVISTNVELRQDGLPFANRKQPTDKGAAVYFTIRKKQMCFACDRWDRIHDNLYAIGKTVEALRGIERWGSGDMVEQAFSGFVALPAPPKWWEVLGIDSDASPAKIERAYLEKARIHHPDAGGSDAAMTAINQARDAALKEVS